MAWGEDSDEEEDDDDDDDDDDEDEDEDEEDDDDDDDEDDDEEDDDDDDDDSSTSSEPTSKAPVNLAASKETLKPSVKAVPKPASVNPAKPAQPRRSNDEKSVADSDASYDLVSGTTSRAPSRAPGSPPQDKKKAIAEESDEEDWE